MELHGGNGSFGTERVGLSEKRWVLPLEEGEPAFPLGVGGLLPVVTVRKDGSEKTVYAFPCEDGPVETGVPAGTAAAPESAPGTAVEAAGAGADAGDARGAAADGAAEADDAGASCPEPVPGAAADAPADPAPALPPAVAALVEAVAFVNKMLVQAASLSGYPFGTLGGIETGIKEAGWGFTRVEVVPLDAHGQPSDSPLHLCIETTDEPGCPDSFNAVLEYDAAGNPARLVMTEYDDEDMYTVRVSADLNEKTGKFSVRKVERITRYTRNKALLYKRGQQPKPDERGRGGRPGGRGGNGGRPGAGGRGRAGGRPGDRRPGDRGGRWERDDRRGGGSRWGRDDRNGRGGRDRW